MGFPLRDIRERSGSIEVLSLILSGTQQRSRQAGFRIRIFCSIMKIIELIGMNYPWNTRKLMKTHENSYILLSPGTLRRSLAPASPVHPVVTTPTSDLWICTLVVKQYSTCPRLFRMLSGDSSASMSSVIKLIVESTCFYRCSGSLHVGSKGLL